MGRHIVALNYFLGRHQVSLTRAQTAASPEARLAHSGLADLYAEQIRAIRLALGVAVTPARVS